MYMKMKQEHANALMTALYCMAINATEELTEEKEKVAEKYARDTFRKLAGHFEEITGRKWDIIPELKTEETENTTKTQILDFDVYCNGLDYAERKIAKEWCNGNMEQADELLGDVFEDVVLYFLEYLGIIVGDEEE